jgi:hypothetical protein
MIAHLLAAALSCDPALTAMFTPPRPRLGRYQVCVSAEPPDRLSGEALAGVHYGAVELLEPLDAFGTAGSYDRAALTRLYAGQRVRVIRGWIERADRFESVTLISPYPDLELGRLVAGTMIVTWTMPLGR